MDPQIRDALGRLKLGFTVALGDVWEDSDVHYVHNEPVARDLADGIAEAVERTRSSPEGAVVLGQAGTGKTHLVRRARMSLAEEGGFFVQFDINSHDDFWDAMLGAYRKSLEWPGDEPQLRTLLLRIIDTYGVSEAALDIKDGRPTVESVNAVVDAVSRRHPDFDDACRDALRVLCIFSSGEVPCRDLAGHWLSGLKEARAGQRSPWGLHPDPRSPREIVSALTRIMALVGPTLVSVDQIDSLVEESNEATNAHNGHTDVRLGVIGNRLMEFKELTRRTFTVVTCLPHSWQQLQATGLNSTAGRFRSPRYLEDSLPGDTAQAIVTAHVRALLRGCDFEPEWGCWPVDPDAFGTTVNLNPRDLLRVVTDHATRCLDRGEFVPLRSFVEPASDGDEADRQQPGAQQRFAQLIDELSGVDVIEKDSESDQFPKLLVAGIESISVENHAGISVRPQYSGKQHGIHAVAERDGYRWVLQGTLDGDGRGIPYRFRWLQEQARTDKNSADGEVIMLRAGIWKDSLAVRNAVNVFERDYGRVIDVDMADLKVCLALKVLQDERPEDLREWLVKERPASGTRLFQDIFGDHSGGSNSDTSPPSGPSPNAAPVTEPSKGFVLPEAVQPAAARGTESTVSFGAFSNGEAATVPLESLRKHVAVFAGSGSGKTVVLRRLVEECALNGVSAIVLDPNNDLARLGDPWPQSPLTWSPGDEAQAEKYFAGTDVVVWTPRMEKGRPVSFQPLPDFKSVLDDVDEFRQALDTAVAILAPKAKVDGRSDKHEQGRAVLREVLAHCARRGKTGLDAFLEVLTDLPTDVVNLSKAPEIAHGMAQTLHAARINDPLFGGAGDTLDPGELLTPKPGKSARISVISLIGLPDASQRQSFVNQLQMALFAWIKRNPAGDKPLGGLFVMDEAQTFAPSGAMTPCTGSTLALASQARKYGLGLVFATQAPRGIHNQIVGNSATQLVGFLNSPTQVSAVKEMVDARRAKQLDIAKLGAGEFYVRTEGKHHRKVVTSMCLSHHPRSALTSDEVMVRARR